MRGAVLAALQVAFFLAVSVETAAGFAVVQNSARDSAREVIRELDPPPAALPAAQVRPGVDSVFAAPGQTYPASGLHRFIFGDLHRDLWQIPFRVAVLDLDTVGGGLEVQELSGGGQTLGLRFSARNGLLYQFRTIVKNARRTIPEILHESAADRVAQDQMAAQFPLAAMVVAELLEAVGVLVAKPRPVVMPDHPKLGDYREAFAGRMGWIEIRPDERAGDRPGFAGSSKILGTEELYEELRSNPRSYVNARALLRARLIDILVGDWDRHSDQWRWAGFVDGERTRWDPIPRDRDWAFSRIDGLLTWLAGVYYPQYVGFEDEYPSIVHLAWASQRVDRTLLSSLDRQEFVDVAADVTSRLTDAVLLRAVRTLPPPYEEAGDSLLLALRARRDGLARVAIEFFELLAREPAVIGTELADSVNIASDGESVRIQLHEAGARGRLCYDHTFSANETKEVRVYLHGGDDRVVIEGPSDLPIAVRIATGEDDDRVIDRTSGSNLYVYNSAGDDHAGLGESAFITNREYLMQDSLRTAAMIWNRRDWGTSWVAMPMVRHESDQLGLLVGARAARFGYGFGNHRCRSCITLDVLRALGAGEWIAELDMHRLLTPNGWWLTGTVLAQTGRPTWFYGFGNNLPGTRNENPFMGFRRTFEVLSGLRFAPDSTWHLSARIAFRRSGEVKHGGAIFDSIPYGGEPLSQIGVRGDFGLDTRDSVSLPTRGLNAHVELGLQPAWLDLEQPFASVRTTLRSYHALRLPGEPTFHLRLVGERVWGRVPYADRPVLGGALTLPGYARSQFRGNAMASATALLRARALSFEVKTAFDFGIHGVTGVGRVWYPGELSATWHRAAGAGIWLHVPAIARTASITFVRGSHLRTYIDFGLMF
jgi:hypothetical protein